MRAGAIALKLLLLLCAVSVATKDSWSLFNMVEEERRTPMHVEPLRKPCRKEQIVHEGTSGEITHKIGDTVMAP